MWPQKTDACWVSMNGKNLGYVCPDTEGRGIFKMNKLIPAMTYPLEIVAANCDGAVSEPAKVSATTTDAFPDLTVLDLKTIPESPKEGDMVTIVASIKNCGNLPTKKGVTVGVKFQLNGKTICWSDKFSGPLAPGKEIELSPNGGPKGQTKFKAAKGQQRITAIVDDMYRIVESNEANNKMTITLTEISEKEK